MFKKSNTKTVMKVILEKTNIEETKEEHKLNEKKKNKTKKKKKKKKKKNILSGKLAYIMVNVNNIFIPVFLKQVNDPVTRKQQCV